MSSKNPAGQGGVRKYVWLVREAKVNLTLRLVVDSRQENFAKSFPVSNGGQEAPLGQSVQDLGRGDDPSPLTEWAEMPTLEIKWQAKPM